jgi:glutaredoxin 3
MNTDQATNQAFVEIYVSALCPYCHWAKQMLDGKSIQYTAYSVDQNPKAREEASRRSNRHTVPQIFINGTSIGGFDDMSLLQSQGKLDAMLAEVP